VRKKLIWLSIAVFAFAGCGGSGGINKATDGGVEVVLNGREPYKLKGELSSLALEKTLVIDTEDDAVAALGVTDIYMFDADSSGGVYLLVPPTGPRDVVYRFSPRGEFVASFGRIGQGPNEMEYPNDLRALDNGEIWVFESPKDKINIFDAGGRPIAGKKPLKFESIIPLFRGNYLIQRGETADLTLKYLPFVLELYDSEFRRIGELDRFSKFENRTIYEKIAEPYVNGIGFVFQGRASQDRIYIGNSERGYEILVLDLAGRPIRKIRKEYLPVPVGEEYKKRYLKDYLEYMPDYAKKIYFPGDWHPFHAILPDEEGRLFVMTYEPGANPGEYIYDIFNKDGLFIARRSLAALHQGNGGLLARIRGDRFYAVEEKPSGFKQLAVYRMTWR